VATFNVSLGRKGPGLLARDLARGGDDQINAVVGIIGQVRPDILVLNDFDFDHGQVALGLLAQQIAVVGPSYPHLFSLRPNAGMASGVDLNGDGRLGGPADAQGFGGFSGRQGMAVLSRFPIDTGRVRDFSALLWKDLPGAVLPTLNGKIFPSQAAIDVQRLSYKGHWDIPVRLPNDKTLHLLVSHTVPPVFDGAENQNGRRNRDEIRFWSLYIDGVLIDGMQFEKDASFIILGDLNADPLDGEGSKQAIGDLLEHPRVRDVKPASKGATAASVAQGGGNKTQLGDPSFDTVDWNESRTPGNMRVDYVLPSVDLVVTGAGVFWPAPGEVGYEFVGSNGDLGSHHRLVWIDIE